MKTKLYNFLTYTFLILFILFPLFTVFNNSEYIVISLIFAILILLLVNFKNVKILENKKTIYFIILLTFLVRILYVIKINNNITQVSDFKYVFNQASLMKFNLNPSKYQIAYHYILYAYLNGLLYKIFGAHQLVSMLFNAVFISGAAILIYATAYKITKNRTISNLASLLYLCWPSITLYTAILSPDHLCLFFILLSTYLLIQIFSKLQNPEKINKSIYIYICNYGWN